MRYIKVNEPFKICGIASLLIREFGPSFVFLGESHPFWEVFAVLSGEVEVVENEKTYMLSAGDVIFHSPDEFHRLRSSGGTAPKTVTYSLIVEGEMPHGLSNGVFHLTDRLLEELAEVSEMLNGAIGENFDGGCDYTDFEEINRRDADGDLIFEGVTRLSALFIAVSKLDASEGRISNTAGAHLYRNIVKTMTERVADNLTVAEIASAHHVSNSYIKKLFKAYAGESPSEYYSRLRIKEAKKRLVAGHTVSEIADAMNFSSAAYFSSYFKKCTGERATDFKKRNDKQA